MSAHPNVTNAEVREHLAVMRRMHNNVGPRVVCGWCKHEVSPGQEPASHTICSECTPTFSHPLNMGDVAYLFTLSELAWGRWNRAAGDDADALHAKWQRANARARTALRLLVEDTERGK